MPRFRPDRKPLLAAIALSAAGLWSHTSAQTSVAWNLDFSVEPSNWSNRFSWLVLPNIVPPDAPGTGALVGSNVTIARLLFFNPYVNLDVDASIGSLTLGSGATLAIGNGRELTLAANSTINGTLTLNASTGFSTLIADGGTRTLTGTGALVLSANPNNKITADEPTDVLLNQITIRGGGQIGADAMGLINQSNIIADTAVPLVIDPSSAGATNAGTLLATNSATLTLQSGNFNNASGTIRADAGSTVKISNATVTGGNITTSGTGALLLESATLSGVNVTNSASGLVRVVSGINTLLGLYNDVAGSQVRVDNGARIIIPGGGNVTINGGLYLDGSVSDTVLEVGTGGLLVNGTGKLFLSNSANNRVIGGGAGASITLASTFTIQGSGKLGDGTLGFVNQGTILANQSVPLIVQPSGLGFSNSGTLRATNGATLNLFNGAFTNTGAGSIVADPGSHVDISGSTIIGGTLTSLGDGHFHALNSSALSSVTISTGTSVDVENGHALRLIGNIVNDGLISLLGSNSHTDLKLDGAVTVNGSGNLKLGDSSFNRVLAASGGSSLTLGAGQTLAGAGQLGDDTLTIANNGTIAATGTNALVVNNVGSTFMNHGTLKATGSGGLTLSDTTVTNHGVIEIGSGSSVTAAGTLTQISSDTALKLSGGTLNATIISLQQGELAGSGTVNGLVTLNGGAELIPGGPDGAGVLTFNDTLTLGASSNTFFQLGGPSAGGYDRIQGTTVTIDNNASLFVSFNNGFQFSIAPTDTFTLISTSTALNGTFAGLADGTRFVTADGLGSFQINYLSNSLTLSNFQAIPEPSTWALLGIGGVGAAIAQLRRRRRAYETIQLRDES